MLSTRRCVVVALLVGSFGGIAAAQPPPEPAPEQPAPEPPAPTGETISVSGRVINPMGRPMRGATVTNEGTEITTKTDRRGQFKNQSPHGAT
ncbi:MAG: hypothetical protein AB7R00_22600, partial [Kofleriaceae bacterium]